MQFIWPIKADYRIVYLDEDYQLIVIGRSKRDYVWVMSRKPDFSDEAFARIKDFVGEVGYDVSRLERIPQRAVQQYPSFGTSELPAAHANGDESTEKLHSEDTTRRPY